MYNRVVLIGRLVADPIVRRNADTAFASFTLAFDDWSRRDAEGNPLAIFMDVKVFNTKTAINIGDSLRKGSVVAVDGKLRQTEYEKGDVKIKKLVVAADSVTFLSPKEAGATSKAQEVEQDFVEEETPVDGEHLDSVDVVDDDLPF